MIRSFDDLGAKVYAFANRDAVTYHVTCTSEAVDRVTALVADAVCNPVSAEKFYYIGDGRNTALAPKQKKFASCGLSQLDDALHEAAFGAFAPLGNPAHSGNALTASVDKVMAFRARTFSPSNLVVSATGISQDALKTAVDTHFKFGAGSKNALPATPLPPSPFIGGDVKIRTGSDKSYAGIAFPVPAGAGANAYILLASALKANTPKGCKVFHHQYADGGLLGFKVSGNSASDAAAKLGAAISSLKAVAAEGVSDAFVKNAVLGESAHSALVKKSLTGVTATAATPAQAAAAAKAALACARPAYAVYGSTHGSASYDAVKAMLK